VGNHADESCQLAVTCRVCNQSVKKSVVFCKECSLIAHLKCVADAPQDCDDLRTRILPLSLDLQRETAFRQGSPSPLTRQHSPPPFSRQTSPPPVARRSGSSAPVAPAEHVSVPIPEVQAPPTERFRFFGKKKSKASSFTSPTSMESSKPSETILSSHPSVSIPKFDEPAEPFTTTKHIVTGHFSVRRDVSTQDEGVGSTRQGGRMSTTESDEGRVSRSTDMSMSDDILMASGAGGEAYRKRRATKRENRDTKDSDASRCVVQ